MEDIRELIREEIRRTINEELDKKFEEYRKSLLEGQFYKEMVFEMKQGLNEVYTTLSEFKRALYEIQSASIDSNSAFQEVSDQLDAIIRATESATTQIMDLTEGIQKKISIISNLIDNINHDKKAEIDSLINDISNSLLSIITACSFQDITGQRIKKVVSAVKSVESKLLEILVSTGIKIKGHESGKKQKDIDEDTRRALELLKGPQENVSQESVDKLLAELGL